MGWQIALLAPGWIHGCLGVRLVLRRRALARRLREVLLAAMIAVPLLSAAGFVSMTRELAARAPATPAPVDPARVAELVAWRDALKAGDVALVLGAIGVGLARAARRPAGASHDGPGA